MWCSVSPVPGVKREPVGSFEMEKTKVKGKSQVKIDYRE